MQGFQPKKSSNELKKPPMKGSNVVASILINKDLEIERLYNKMFDNCKHRSGWCVSSNDCKHCQFMKWGLKMFIVKKCECGSTDFEKESDDNVLRCAKCFRLARIKYIPEKEERGSNEIL